MPFNPFTSVTGRNALTLFDIRLDNDFIVFRGNEHEAGAQMLKGVLAICVPAPIKIEDIHLRLTGTQRLVWSDPKVTPSGLASTKVDRTNSILHHQWKPFWGTPGKSAILEKGNYEFPFELLLPGDTCESVEGLGEASITYKLKATIARGKLAYDLHAYKHVRIVRTLESSALEFLHAMSVENIWPNKIEYSIVVPQKAVVFGSHIPLESRFTPLLKGLELGDITVRLVEIHDFVAGPAAGSSSYSSLAIREYKHERTVDSWTVRVTRQEHWQEMIEDTGQEGWVVNTSLGLPHKLGKCIQDVNVHGIKVRHKLKMVVALKNPDGHVSELRATLPLTIFISPNIPLDENGNLTTRLGAAGDSTAAAGVGGGGSGSGSGTADGLSVIAPPGYGEHVLDQLYDDMDVNALQTPAPMSTVHSPMYGMSRAGSSENLASMASNPVHPAALTSRLQDVSAREATLRRNRGSAVFTPPGPPAADATTPFTPLHLPHSFMHRSGSHANDLGNATAPATLPPSETLSRRNSGESHHSNGSDGSGEHSDPEHVDFADLQELSKVPSYATAMKTTRVNVISPQLPDYNTAASRPDVSRTSSSTSLSSGLHGHSLAVPSGPTSGSSGSGGGGGGGGVLTSEPLSLIAEAPHENAADVAREATSAPATRHNSNGGSDEDGAAGIPRQPRTHHHSRAAGQPADQAAGGSRRRALSSGVSFLHGRHTAPTNGDSDERSWLHLLQARGRVAT